MEQRQELEVQLENRKHNLAIVEETMKRDTISGQILSEVRDFLHRRIEQLERELKTTA